MQIQPLNELLQDLEQEMLRLGYTTGSMQFYRRRWQMLFQFAQERGETYYSERLGINFVEKHFHIFEKDLNRTLSQSEIQELRIIRMIGDFQLHHTVLGGNHFSSPRFPGIVSFALFMLLYLPSLCERLSRLRVNNNAPISIIQKGGMFGIHHVAYSET